MCCVLSEEEEGGNCGSRAGPVKPTERRASGRLGTCHPGASPLSRNDLSLRSRQRTSRTSPARSGRLTRARPTSSGHCFPLSGITRSAAERPQPTRSDSSSASQNEAASAFCARTSFRPFFRRSHRNHPPLSFASQDGTNLSRASCPASNRTACGSPQGTGFRCPAGTLR